MPDFTNDPSINRAAYQRGKWLTLVVVVGTALWWLRSVLKDFASGYMATGGTVSKGNPWLNLILSVTMIYLLCRAAWRGGKTSTGCLTIFYSLGVAACAFAAVLFTSMVLGFQAYRIKEMGVAGLPAKWVGEGIGQELAENVSLLATTAWMLFALWVLVRSEDARFYRDARQRSIWLGTPPPLDAPPPPDRPSHP